MAFVWSGLHPFLMREIVEEIIKYLDLVDYVRFRAVNKVAFDSVTPVWIQNQQSDIVKWKLEMDFSYRSWEKSAGVLAFHFDSHYADLLRFNYPPIEHFAKLIKPMRLSFYLNRHAYDRPHIMYLLLGLYKNIPKYPVSHIYISRNWDNPDFPLRPLLEQHHLIEINDKWLSFEQVVHEFRKKGIALIHDRGGGGGGMGNKCMHIHVSSLEKKK